MLDSASCLGNPTHRTAGCPTAIKPHLKLFRRTLRVLRTAHTSPKPLAFAHFEPSPSPSDSRQGRPSALGTSGQGSTGIQWPEVDWGRYHLQILFVDRTDTVRGRLAAGIFERIAEWNGFGRALYPWSVGLHTSGAWTINEVAKLAAVSNEASYLRISPRSFTRTTEQFDLGDLDRYDLILPVDSSLRAEILSQVEEQHREYYNQKVCLLTDFSSYNQADSVVTRVGGLALLPMQLSFLLKPGLAQSKNVVDISTPQLADSNGAEQWEATVQALILANAGLVKYLMDCLPADLPNYDPVD